MGVSKNKVTFERIEFLSILIFNQLILIVITKVGVLFSAMPYYIFPSLQFTHSCNLGCGKKKLGFICNFRVKPQIEILICII